MAGAFLAKVGKSPCGSCLRWLPVFGIHMDLFFRNSLGIEVRFDGEDQRKIVESKVAGQESRELAPLFGREETVKGTVTLRPKDGRKVDHSGVRVQFIGCIEINGEKNIVDEFISVAQDVASAGEARHAETFPFEFRNVDKPYESYNGKRVRLRYFVRVSIPTKYSEIVRERDIWVYNYQIPVVEDTAVNMDVGIEDCLHIEFEYEHSKLELTQPIVGQIYFMLVRLKLKHMELSLVRREITGSPHNQRSESETVVRYEIMDGSPVKGEQIPIRLYLGGFDLIPTMKDINKKFSVRTFLSLVLIDEAGRRYFKQSEITLYRAKKEPVLEK